MTINKRTEGTELFEVTMKRKNGKAETINVYAKNRLDAMNTLIKMKIYGNIQEIRSSSANLLK